MLLEDVEADGAVGVNIRVVDPCREIDLGRLEWIIGWEADVQEKYSTRKGRVIWAHDGGLPMVLVLVVNWTGGAVREWVFSQLDELFLNSVYGRHFHDFN